LSARKAGQRHSPKRPHASKPPLYRGHPCPEEYELSLRQADQARANCAAIEDDLDFIKTQLALLPSRAEVARLILLATLATGALVLLVAMLTR
jgi:hypothetical protein